MAKEKYLRLGEFLVKEGLITPAQLETAINTQRKESGRLGEILIKLGMIKEDQMVMALGKQLGISYFTSGTSMLKPTPDMGLEELIPNDFAVKNAVIPLSRTLRSLTVAMADPLDIMLLDNIKQITGCQVNPVIAIKSDIIKAIELFYGKDAMLSQAVSDSYDRKNVELAENRPSAEIQELSLDKLAALAEEAPVVKLVDLIIQQAIEEHASDIHIEPFKDKICLRYRIDGKLYEIPPPAKYLHLPILSRIKILSKLDIAEKRLPQDGSIIVKIHDKPVDIRVSTIPTIFGEKVVLRILDRSNIIINLTQLGFSQAMVEKISKVIESPYGLVFVTGPTGSGKSTTLYAMLNQLKSPSKNIITVEDPVEYKIEGINQLQVKPEIGLTFAAALRSFLRQDPDVMLVGEVRDLETAQICVRSSLTGHLVLSTIHTNDAPSAVNRLMDIGIEPYMLAPSLLMIIGQRLVRKLCPDCKEAYELSPEQSKNCRIKAELVYRPKGCSKCNNNGYRGRLCIAEVMLINPELQALINQRATLQQIREAARKNGMQTIYEAGIKQVEAGVTSLEEVISVSMGID